MSSSLIFFRGGERFAVALEHVRRICGIREIQQLPMPAQDVEGVIPDGSHIVPVIATPLPPLRPDCVRPRVLLLNNGDCPFGLRVEALEGPKELHPAETWDVPPSVGRVLADVPPDAVIGLATAVAPPSPGMAPSPAIEHIIQLDPALLYRARSHPEEGHEHL